VVLKLSLPVESIWGKFFRSNALPQWKVYERMFFAQTLIKIGLVVRGKLKTLSNHACQWKIYGGTFHTSHASQWKVSEGVIKKGEIRIVNL
jgi:hypothetical protein